MPASAASIASLGRERRRIEGWMLGHESHRTQEAEPPYPATLHMLADGQGKKPASYVKFLRPA